MFKKIINKIVKFFKNFFQQIKEVFTDTAYPAIDEQTYQDPTLKRLSQRRISITNLNPKEYYLIALRDNELGFNTTMKILRHSDLTTELTSDEIVNLIVTHQHRFQPNGINIDVLLRIQDSSLYELAASSPRNMLKLLNACHGLGRFGALAKAKLIFKHRNSHLIKNALYSHNQPEIKSLGSLLHQADQEDTLGIVWNIMTSSLGLLKLLHIDYKYRLSIDLNIKSSIFNPYEILDLHQESSSKSIALAFQNKLSEIKPKHIDDLNSKEVKSIHTAYAILSKPQRKKAWDIKHPEKEDKEELAASHKMV